MNLCPELRRLSAGHARAMAEVAVRHGESADSRASRLLAFWDEELLARFRLEEDVLLPELSSRLSEADAVVVFTLSDHVALKRLVRALRAASGPERAAASAALADKLAEHMAFAERTLLPALQATLGCARMASLGRELALGEAGPGEPRSGTSRSGTSRSGTSGSRTARSGEAPPQRSRRPTSGAGGRP